jgi:transposase
VSVELPNTIEGCHRFIEQLLLVIEKQQGEIELLKQEVSELKAKLNENSQNSNRPPSSDGFNKPNPKPAFAGKNKKRRGGQPGHLGKTLKRVETADVVVDCEPLSCVCGKTQWIDEAEVMDSRQVFELPEPRLEVIEYRRIRRNCRCGRRVCGEFPEKVTAPVQYGERVQAMVALLSVQGCLSFGKINQLFADLYGYELNEATAQRMLQRSSEVMPIEAIKAEITKSAVVNFDETGIRENGRLKWLHSASTSTWTYQFVDEKRGRSAMMSEASILAEYKGVAVHDCWESYFGFSEMKHALCNAHLLRELTAVMETSAVKWAGKMKRLLENIYVASAYAKGVVRDYAKYEKSYERILKQGEKQEPLAEKRKPRGKLKRSKGRNLLERMSKHKEAVLRFAREAEVPFTNNQAERDIRPIKVKQKMSGGFRAQSGTESYCRINSMVSSLRKQGRKVFQELVSIIKGKPFEVFQT